MVSKTQVDWLSAHIEQIALANDPAIHLTTSSINRAETMVEATATKQAAASTKVPAAFEAGESPTQNITPARANETTIMDKLDEISSAASAEARVFVLGQHPGEPKNAPPRVQATAPLHVEATAPKLETIPERVQNAEEVPPGTERGGPRQVGDTTVRAKALRATP